MVEIFTDGSTKGNGKKENCGGAGLTVLKPDSVEKAGFRIDYIWSIQENNTTNNRMELTALLKALELSQTKYKDEKCIIKSDSAYCVNIFNEWIYIWNKNNWTRYKNQPIENLDLVKQLWEYCKIGWSNFTVEKVPGHAGVLGNELSDALATNDKAKFDKILKKYDIEKEKIENIDFN